MGSSQHSWSLGKVLVGHVYVEYDARKHPHMYCTGVVRGPHEDIFSRPMALRLKGRQVLRSWGSAVGTRFGPLSGFGCKAR